MSNNIDVEEERKLAADFVAETTGPYVDEPRPTSQLAKEYERGHKTYQKKIDSLASAFPLWRRLKGDGSCGFRAILFGLFESILTSSNPDALQNTAKMLSQKWRSLSIDELYEGWLEEITDLISRLQEKHDGGGDAKALLVEEFNHADNQRNYIQFLRTLTATYIRANRELYQASMDEDLESWCQQHLEIPDAEIEYVSLAAAYAVLLADFEITLKIHHMDLSPGTEANIHTLSPDNSTDSVEVLPTIWMLYRPGHYDLVYSAVTR